MKTCTQICLGPEGSFSQDAIKSAWHMLGLDRSSLTLKHYLVDHNEYVIPQFVSCSGRAIASLAVHTLAEGRLESSFKKICGLLDRHEDVKIFGAIDMPITFHLLARKGVRQVKGILANEKAVGACKEFLDLLNVPIITVGSNSRAAKRVAEEDEYKEFGAVSSERCAKLYGLELKHRGLEGASARTIFYIFGKGFDAPSIPFKDWRGLVVCDIPNVPAALHKAITPIANAKINIVHMQTLYAQDGRYRHCIELEGEGAIASARSALKDMENHTERMLSFGPFPFVSL